MDRAAVENLITSQFSDAALVINEKGEVSARALPSLRLQQKNGPGSD